MAGEAAAAATPIATAMALSLSFLLGPKVERGSRMDVRKEVGHLGILANEFAKQTSARLS